MCLLIFFFLQKQKTKQNLEMHQESVLIHKVKWAVVYYLKFSYSPCHGISLKVVHEFWLTDVLFIHVMVYPFPTPKLNDLL